MFLTESWKDCGHHVFLQFQEDCRGPHGQGLHRHSFVQNPEKNTHGDPQALQDLQDPEFLHEEGEVHADQLQREAGLDPLRVSQA